MSNIKRARDWEIERQTERERKRKRGSLQDNSGSQLDLSVECEMFAPSYGIRRAIHWTPFDTFSKAFPRPFPRSFPAICGEQLAEHRCYFPPLFCSRHRLQKLRNPARISVLLLYPSTFWSSGEKGRDILVLDLKHFCADFWAFSFFLFLAGLIWDRECVNVCLCATAGWHMSSWTHHILSYMNCGRIRLWHRLCIVWTLYHANGCNCYDVSLTLTEFKTHRGTDSQTVF